MADFGKRNGTIEDAEDALDRMARAERRGTGCYLTPAMIAGLSLTQIGAYWHQDRSKSRTGAPDV